MSSRIVLVCALALSFWTAPGHGQVQVIPAATTIFDQLATTLLRTTVYAIATSDGPLYAAPPGRLGTASQQVASIRQGEIYRLAETHTVASVFGSQYWIRIEPADSRFPRGSAADICAGSPCWAFAGRSTSSTQNFEFKTEQEM